MRDSVVFVATVVDVNGVFAAAILGDYDFVKNSFRLSLDECPFTYHDKVAKGSVILSSFQMVIDDKPFYTLPNGKTYSCPLEQFLSNEFDIRHCCTVLENFYRKFEKEIESKNESFKFEE